MPTYGQYFKVLRVRPIKRNYFTVKHSGVYRDQKQLDDEQEKFSMLWDKHTMRDKAVK